MILFSDRGCPFAHRVRALLEYLGAPYELRESMVGDKPHGLDAYVASGRIPLLVHGDLVITESRVILEHLAEHLGFEAAYPADLSARTRHRHAMALIDVHLAPLLFVPSSSHVHNDRLDDVLNAIELATTGTARPGLLAFHAAPIWLRFRLWHPSSAVTQAVERRAALCGWLDGATQLECLQRTSPDPGTQLDDLDRARRAGLMS